VERRKVHVAQKTRAAERGAGREGQARWRAPWIGYCAGAAGSVCTASGVAAEAVGISVAATGAAAVGAAAGVAGTGAAATLTSGWLPLMAEDAAATVLAPVWYGAAALWSVPVRSAS